MLQALHLFQPESELAGLKSSVKICQGRIKGKRAYIGIFISYELLGK